ncbi:hypothetical protein [Streptosporangium sp. NPDC023615]|uniref:hypothetical protein n=1 Tax=Streptosporangium sp. NPDC023615 TaxID=3154794 RepID=UPI00342752C0
MNEDSEHDHLTPWGQAAPMPTMGAGAVLLALVLTGVCFTSRFAYLTEAEHLGHALALILAVVVAASTWMIPKMVVGGQVQPHRAHTLMNAAFSAWALAVTLATVVTVAVASRL